MGIIDSHAHINDEKLYPRRAEIADYLDGEGIDAVINVGCRAEDSAAAVELSGEFEKFYAAVGIHPHDSVTASADVYNGFAEFAKNEKVVAIGEIGLDFHYDSSPRDVQERVFSEQLELARFLDLPVIIHLRDAYGPMLKLLKENADKLRAGFLLHCYGGSEETAAELVKLGGYFSFGGPITFKNAKDKPDIVRSIPRERLLVETDCPYLAPEPFRGRDNEPKFVKAVAARMGEILGESYESIAETTAKNAKEFFKKLK